MLKTIYTDKYDIVGDSPAVIVESLQTGHAVIYLNKNIFPRLTPFQQKFVVQHEIGHYLLDTDSEIAADTYAFDALAGTEFQSLKQSIAAIYDIIPVMNGGRVPRLKSMVENALEWDYINGNNIAGEELARIKSMTLEDFIFYFEKRIKKRGFALWDVFTLGGYSLAKNAINRSNDRKDQQVANEAAQKQYELESARKQNENNSDLAGQQQQTTMMMVVIMAVAAILIMGD
ncbi:MAG: ImmA/IrrE family metallo-endopeptidase [Paludibacter sp.]|nr:ImmA/IrrE family metallo-endopeptidase [Paludibacter sp.]